jgi:hypothetical protein
LFIDKDARITINKPNVDIKTLLNTVLKENLVPLVITKLSLLTINKGFANIAREYSFFKFGPFNITYSEIEIIIRDREIYIYLEIYI